MRLTGAADAWRETNIVAAHAAAAFPRRGAALAVDALALSIVQAVINTTFGVTRVTGGSPVALDGGVTAFTTATTVGEFWLVVAAVGYFALFEALFRATPGKWLLGLRVTDYLGRRPGLTAVIVRNLLRPVDAFPVLYGVGLLCSLTNHRRQRLGDLAAGTIVVRVEAVTQRPLSQRATRRLVALATALLLFAAVCAGFSYFGRPPLVVEGIVNTHEAPFEDNAGEYQLSDPRWGDGTVSYDVRFAVRTAGATRMCAATLTLRWGGWLYGWQPGYSVVDCPAR